MQGSLRRTMIEVLARHPEVVVSYLFGSHGRGRPHRQSDVDVGVLLDRERLPTKRDRFRTGLRLATSLMGALGRDDVDLVVLNEVPPQFARRIALGGDRLTCRDPAADHAFRRDVQLRAADLEPFLRRGRKRLLETLAR